MESYIFCRPEGAFFFVALAITLGHIAKGASTEMKRGGDTLVTGRDERVRIVTGSAVLCARPSISAMDRATTQKQSQQPPDAERRVISVSKFTWLHWQPYLS